MVASGVGRRAGQSALLHMDTKVERRFCLSSSVALEVWMDDADSKILVNPACEPARVDR